MARRRIINRGISIVASIIALSIGQPEVAVGESSVLSPKIQSSRFLNELEQADVPAPSPVLALEENNTNTPPEDLSLEEKNINNPSEDIHLAHGESLVRRRDRRRQLSWWSIALQLIPAPPTPPPTVPPSQQPTPGPTPTPDPTLRPTPRPTNEPDTPQPTPQPTAPPTIPLTQSPTLPIFSPTKCSTARCWFLFSQIFIASSVALVAIAIGSRNKIFVKEAVEKSCAPLEPLGGCHPMHGMVARRMEYKEMV